MNDVGVFAVHRGFFDHTAFKPEPFTEREAWLWMIGQAAWKPMKKRVKRAVYDLARGQLVGARGYLAEAWQWDESRVRRFLDRIEKLKMIKRKTTGEPTTITICNYDDYQFGRPLGRPATDQQPTSNRPQEEELNNSRKERLAPEPAPDETVVDLLAFKGRIVKVNADQYERWRKNYCEIELRDELALADDYYFDNPPKDGKWFFPVARWLDRAQKRARDVKRAELRARGDAW